MSKTLKKIPFHLLSNIVKLDILRYKCRQCRNFYCSCRHCRRKMDLCRQQGIMGVCLYFETKECAGYEGAI